MEPDEAIAYLKALLTKNLRISTTDGRLFWGAFKCTDANQNVVLSHTYEYRQPVSAQGSASHDPFARIDVSAARYLGLVVVPGHHIVRMELEKFVSQIKTTISQDYDGSLII
ncbi:LSM domain-containing protein [Ophiocordyceps camponoti-floridani]|uniref:LSM domain-containing protein n=1 Tax=Ophiocordyceps camponoti-floridani TaxID=2030778 RepID=A0A8H4VED0_9HYPO|nr:LSM domain-containing protein [Ophiocordyceps camponoti-floridani]